MQFKSELSLEIYLAELGQYKVLSFDEEQFYFEKMATGDKNARQKIIGSNLKLVVSIAKDYYNAYLTMNDLIGEGNIGLIKAVDKFDYKKGYKFSTFATPWIKQSISRSIMQKAKTISIPVYLQENYRKYLKFIEKSFISGKKFSDKEVSNILNISLSQIEHFKFSMNDILSLNENITLNSNEEVDCELIELLEDRTVINPEEYVLEENVIDNLDDKSRLIMSLRFGFNNGKPHTLDEIGSLLSISKERVRQRLNVILEKVYNDLTKKVEDTKPVSIKYEEIEKNEDYLNLKNGYNKLKSFVRKSTLFDADDNYKTNVDINDLFDEIDNLPYFNKKNIIDLKIKASELYLKKHDETLIADKLLNKIINLVITLNYNKKNNTLIIQNRKKKKL